MDPIEQTPIVEAPVAPVTTDITPVETAPVEATEGTAPLEVQSPTVVTPPSEGSVEGSESASEAATKDAPTSETILGEALTKEAPTEDAPAEKAEGDVETDTPEESSDGETKNEGGQSDEPASPPKYDQFTLPEDIKLDESKVGEFTSLLAELETSGEANHEAVQAFGQKAVEFHINEVKNAVENITNLYQQAWDRQKTDWKESFLKDPEIGGNRFQTTVDSALSFIRTHGGTPEQQQEFRALMETSGLGNHPAMIRMLANAGRAFQEGKPLAAPKPVPQQKSKTQTLYGKS